MKRTSLTASGITIVSGRGTVYIAAVSFNIGNTMETLIGQAPTAAPAPAPAPAAAPAPTAITFTGITAIDVLKFENKFYLAVGDPGSDTSAGKVGVFEGTDSGFSDIEQTFRVEGDIGEWFGWSVKLQKLSSEPVLFVGAPKATIGSTSGVGM